MIIHDQKLTRFLLFFFFPRRWIYCLISGSQKFVKGETMCILQNSPVVRLE